MTSKMRILIADDHVMVAAGIQAILKLEPAFEVLKPVENGREVLKWLETDTADLILMDINMPEMNGIDCTRKVKALYPGIKVIVLTMYNRRQFIRELIDIGADGCVLKNNTGRELLTAIERVIAGKTYFDDLHGFVDHAAELQQYKLSEREIEVIIYITENLSSSEIAQRMFISEHTVKTHRKNIFRKLNIRDADELVRFAINEGIV
jgi:DNA-binding NarL/FixJ family response regulator